MLANCEFDMHLITLAEFHVTAFNMHKLADKFSMMGINAFVQNIQRLQSIYYITDSTYTYYKHESTTKESKRLLIKQQGLINTLSGSTKADNI